MDSTCCTPPAVPYMEVGPDEVLTEQGEGEGADGRDDAFVVILSVGVTERESVCPGVSSCPTHRVTLSVVL